MGIPTNVGETLEYTSELGKNLIRTGTIQDGSCLIHSLLTAINPTHKRKTKRHPEGIDISYKSSTLTERKRMAIRERRKMANEWAGNGRLRVGQSGEKAALNAVINNLTGLIRLLIDKGVIEQDEIADASMRACAEIDQLKAELRDKSDA